MRKNFHFHKSRYFEGNSPCFENISQEKAQLPLRPFTLGTQIMKLLNEKCSCNKCNFFYADWTVNPKIAIEIDNIIDNTKNQTFNIVVHKKFQHFSSSLFFKMKQWLKIHTLMISFIFLTSAYVAIFFWNWNLCQRWKVEFNFNLLWKEFFFHKHNWKCKTRVCLNID